MLPLGTSVEVAIPRTSFNVAPTDSPLVSE